MIIFGSVSAVVGGTACAVIADTVGKKVASAIVGGLTSGGFVALLVWLIVRALRPSHRAWGNQTAEATDAEVLPAGHSQPRPRGSQLSLAAIFQLNFMLAIAAAAAFYMVRAVQNTNTGSIFGDMDDAFTAIVFVLAAPTLILTALALAWRMTRRK